MIQSAMHHNYDYFKNNERDEYLQNATDELEHFIGTNFLIKGKLLRTLKYITSDVIFSWLQNI